MQFAKNREGSVAITTEFVKTGVTNFFSNLNDIAVVVNDVLQFKVHQALSDTTRFYVDFKADLLTARKLVGEAAVDEYEFVKNVYFDRRDNLIHDRTGPVFPGDEESGDKE